MAKKLADEVVGLYRTSPFDMNVRHFHENLSEEMRNCDSIDLGEPKVWRNNSFVPIDQCLKKIVKAGVRGARFDQTLDRIVDDS